MTQDLSFCGWLTSLRIMSSRPIRVECASGASGFPPLCRQIRFRCLDGLLAQSPVGGHVGCFHLLDIVSSAAVNTDAHTSALLPAHESFGHVPGSGIAGPHGNSIFHFLRTRRAVFHSGRTILRPPSSAQAVSLVISCFVLSLFCLGQYRPHRCKAACHCGEDRFLI